jgi:hypothetical protein
MQRHRSQVPAVTDGLIGHLARRSKADDLDQETRVSVFTFGGPADFDCLIWDRDVLRVPSIVGLYHPLAGSTALIDGTHKLAEAWRLIPQIHGDHAVLAYMATDGEENNSRRGARAMQKLLTSLGDNETVGFLVPNQGARHEAKRWGVPAGNIEVWDTTSTKGFEEAGQRVTASADAYMAARSTGARSSNSLFLNTLTPDTIKRNLTEVTPGSFTTHPVGSINVRIDVFCQREFGRYEIGKAFYQLTEAVNVQPGKKIAIRTRSNGRVYMGSEARTMLGIPADHVRIRKLSPSAHPDYDIFIQSASHNRVLKPGTDLLVLR